MVKFAGPLNDQRVHLSVWVGVFYIILLSSFCPPSLASPPSPSVGAWWGWLIIELNAGITICVCGGGSRPLHTRFAWTQLGERDIIF